MPWRSRSSDRPDSPVEQPANDLVTDDPVSDDLTSNLSSEVRSIDGTGNNLENAEFRATDTELLRVAENDYADGISEPAGEDRPSAREISNVLSAADPDGTTSERNLSSFVFAWGQFLDHDIDPSIANEFSTAAFRFGHSTLNDEFRLVGNDGEEVAEAISLAGAFFTPELLEETGIDSFLKYTSSTQSQEIDLEVVDCFRNFLFGPPGSGGLDLVSLNIQRRRDHGLADYKSTREAYGLESVESFADVTSHEDVQANLEALYGDVNNIDLWVGLMAEDHTENGSLGKTATTIIADQFERLRDGDRFYYENTMSEQEVSEIESTTLGGIIERNTNLDSLQSNVFFFAPEITGTVVAESATPQQSEATELVSDSIRDPGGPSDGQPAGPTQQLG